VTAELPGGNFPPLAGRRLRTPDRMLELQSSLRAGEADEAIQPPGGQTGLLRFARNDENAGSGVAQEMPLDREGVTWRSN
jgi:hypothetical protein